MSAEQHTNTIRESASTLAAWAQMFPTLTTAQVMAELEKIDNAVASLTADPAVTQKIQAVIERMTLLTKIDADDLWTAHEALESVRIQAAQALAELEQALRYLNGRECVC